MRIELTSHLFVHQLLLTLPPCLELDMSGMSHRPPKKKMRLLLHLSLGVCQVFFRLRAASYSSQKQWTSHLSQILATHPPLLALLKQLARGAVWVERREVRKGLRTQLWFEKTEVSVMVGGTEGALTCSVGSLIIIPVVGMVGFSAGATLEDPSAAVLGGGRVSYLSMLSAVDDIPIPLPEDCYLWSRDCPFQSMAHSSSAS